MGAQQQELCPDGRICVQGMCLRYRLRQGFDRIAADDPGRIPDLERAGDSIQQRLGDLTCQRIAEELVRRNRPPQP